MSEEFYPITGLAIGVLLGLGAVLLVTRAIRKRNPTLFWKERARDTGLTYAIVGLGLGVMGWAFGATYLVLGFMHGATATTLGIGIYLAVKHRRHDIEKSAKR